MDQQKKILVVEDEKSIARPISLKLQFSGYKTVVATDGQMALDLLTKEPFDLILLDVILPKLNGFAVLEQLQARGNKIPVIVASNLSQVEDIDRVKKLGAVGYYIKSNTPLGEIVEQIKKVLNPAST